jgi:uncharacterized membrane protein
MLRKILIAIVILIAIPFIAALFIKKEYAVEREITISRPKQEVFDYIKHLKNQDNYSKWAKMDPNMKKSYRGTDATVGFVSAWESEKDDVGTGEQEITGITDGERIDFELRFFVPFESTSPAYMTTQSVSDTETKVVWGFAGNMPYPMNLLIPLMNFEKAIGDDLATGLGNLKVELEK